MVMNSPSGPIEATRNAGIVTAIMAARDRERTHDELDERERDRLEQERFSREEVARQNRPGLFRRLVNWLPFS